MLQDGLRVSSYTVVISETTKVGHHYILHGYSGAIDLVPQRIATALETREVEAILKTSNGLIDRLISRSFLTDLEEEEELFLFGQVAAVLHEKRLEKTRFEISPGFGCNFGCAYCYQGELRANLLAARRSNANLMPTLDREKVDSILSAIQAIAPKQENRLPVVLLGGEPLMRAYKRQVGYLLHRGAEEGHTFFIITNGADFCTMTDILENVPLDAIQFTLDGPRDEHERRRPRLGPKQSFDDILLAIEWCLGRDIQVSVRINVDEALVARLPELLYELDQRGFLRNDYFYGYIHVLFGGSQLKIDQAAVALAKTEPLLEYVDVDAEVERVIRQLLSSDGTGLSPGYCAATSRNFVFHPDGRIFACGQDMGMGHQESLIGRYYPDIEIDKWTMEKWQKRNIQYMPACLKCPVGLLHGGGCANLSMRYGGNSLMDPYCEEFPERLNTCFPYTVEKWFKRRGKQLAGRTSDAWN